MLRVLHIKNFSIIDDVKIEFGEGLNVLTGETGAGKSIIIDALCLALGERATSEAVRTGEKEAVVAAFFDISPELLNSATTEFLENFGIDINEGLILKRIVSIQGKSRAFINGSMVNVQNISDVSRNIIDVHGQYEHQSLLSTENQIDILDVYGGLHAERNDVKNIYESLCSSRKNIEKLVQKEKERTQRTDLLKFQINEIGAANLNPGEEERLSEEMKVLNSAIRLAELANASFDDLYSSDSAYITGIKGVLNSMKEISYIDPRASDALKSIEGALPLLEDAAFFLRDYRDRLDFDPDRLDQISERIETIKGLKRKYGNSVQEILDYKGDAEIELEELQNAEEILETLKHELEEIRTRLTDRAHKLSKKRKATAREIESAVISQLSEVSMPDTRFSILFKQEKGDDTEDGLMVTQKGIDIIEFLISPNIGEDLKPLSKIASGGELSRIMLALKSIMAKGDNIPVLIFDEIDAGIGGATAENVGKKLKKLSSDHQVICITHLPQIASYADRHLKIEKKVRKDRTVVEITSLEKDERPKEIARMLGGEISEVSLKHAREMIKKSR